MFTIALLLLSLLLPSDGCLPSEHGGQLEPVPGSAPGELDQLGDLPVHRYGPASGAKWLLWGHDIFGVESGRAREYCARMAAQLNITCILPDFFRAAPPNFLLAIVSTSLGGLLGSPVPTWVTLQADWEDKLVPYLTAAGAESVVVAGTCYGSYLGVHMSASPLVKGAIYFHPSHPASMANAGEDEAEVYRQIGSPQAFMDTPDSAPSVRPGGLASQILQTVD